MLIISEINLIMGEFMETELKNEIQFAEALIRKANQIMNENESKIGDIKADIEDKISLLKDAIGKKDLNLIKTTMEKLQIPISKLSSRVYEPAQEESDPLACDECKVSFKLPPGLAPKVKKKKKDEEA